jgi:hypothetical protein
VTTIERKGIQIDIDVFKAKIKLHQAMLDAHLQKAVNDRALVSGLVETFIAERPPVTMAGQPILRSLLNEWQKSQIADAKSKADVMRIELAQMESQVQIREAMLRQAESNVITPGGFKA